MTYIVLKAPLNSNQPTNLRKTHVQKNWWSVCRAWLTSRAASVMLENDAPAWAWFMHAASGNVVVWLKTDRDSLSSNELVKSDVKMCVTENIVKCSVITLVVNHWTRSFCFTARAKTLSTQSAPTTLIGVCAVPMALFMDKVATLYLYLCIITRAHSFPRQILPNSAAPFAKFCGSPRQILGIPRLTAAAQYTVPTLAQLYTCNFK